MACAVRNTLTSPYPYVVVWNGMVFVRHGVYQGACFSFKINIPDKYPDCECPVSIFMCLWREEGSVMVLK